MTHERLDTLHLGEHERGRTQGSFADTKFTHDTGLDSTGPISIPATHAAVLRKFRIQRHRLTAWTRARSKPESVKVFVEEETLARAASDEVVGDVVSSIRDILVELEPLSRELDQQISRTEASSPEKDSLYSSKSMITPSFTDKPVASSADDSRILEDTVKDLSASIDILYDLSHAMLTLPKSVEKSQLLLEASSAGSDIQASSYTSSRIRTPRRIDPSTLSSSLDFPEAGIFDAEQVKLSKQRQIVYMRHVEAESAEQTSPTSKLAVSAVFLEYATYDSMYTKAGMAPSLTRLEKLTTGLQKSDASPSAMSGLFNLLGYFEDEPRSRYGYVQRLV